MNSNKTALHNTLYCIFLTQTSLKKHETNSTWKPELLNKVLDTAYFLGRFSVLNSCVISEYEICSNAQIFVSFSKYTHRSIKISLAKGFYEILKSDLWFPHACNLIP